MLATTLVKRLIGLAIFTAYTRKATKAPAKTTVKTDGPLLPGNLQSGFLLESVIGDSAFQELQTSVRRGTSPVYSAGRAAAPRRQQNHCAGHKSRTGNPWDSSTRNLLVCE